MDTGLTDNEIFDAYAAKFGWVYDNGGRYLGEYWDWYAGPVPGVVLVRQSPARVAIVRYEGLTPVELWSGQVVTDLDFEKAMALLGFARIATSGNFEARNNSRPTITASPSFSGTAVCFALAALAFVLAVMCIMGVVVMDEVRDVHGEIVLDFDGQPKFAVNHWQTWLRNWRAHSFFAIALIFFAVPMFRHLRQVWRGITRRNNGRLDEHSR